MDDPPGEILLALFSGIGLDQLFSLIAIIILLVISGLVSASEVAFFSLTPNDLEQLRARGDSSSLAVVELLSKPRLLLATVLIANNFVNVAVVTISTFLMWQLSGTHNPVKFIVVVVTFVVTFALTFFGEIVPKVYATKHNMSFAHAMAGFWKVCIVVCKPVSLLLMQVSKVVERRIEKRGYQATVEGLNQALDIAAGNDETTRDEKQILKGIVNFGTLTARQIMCSRMDISSVDIEMDFHQLLDYINKSGFSRLPVFRETIDKVEGILYIKDLLPYIEQDEKFQWQKLLRPGFFIPETKKIDSLLKDFQSKHVHMAIVVDEYGGTSGVITLEDVIEEIIGDINDEFDEATHNIQKVDEETYVFEGKVSLHDMSKAMDIPEDFFDAVRGDSESLGGLILELNQKLPRAGQRVSFRNFTFNVESADRRRIKRVRVHREPDAKPAEE